ncbi:MAG: hypothetical protein LBC06_01100 [Rickettsiales bacterium]|jgi:hypothetical protein|nr:hypothetical protein [Rickettsiales bacterium]
MITARDVAYLPGFISFVSAHDIERLIRGETRPRRLIERKDKDLTKRCYDYLKNRNIDFIKNDLEKSFTIDDYLEIESTPDMYNEDSVVVCRMWCSSTKWTAKTIKPFYLLHTLLTGYFAGKKYAYLCVEYSKDRSFQCFKFEIEKWMKEINKVLKCYDAIKKKCLSA